MMLWYKIDANRCFALKLFMYKLYIVLACVVSFSCNKQVDPLPEPLQMQYTDLHNAEVKSNRFVSVDIDADGKNDFLFQTLLVGDALLKRDRFQFYAYSKIGTYLLIDAQEQTPVLNAGDAILIHNFRAAEWYEVAATVLAEKITEESGTTHWEGAWKSTAHHYLPVQIMKVNSRYTGWIELSFNTEMEMLVLHRAAISTVAQKDSKAGL
jgi:hypothetical protein